MLKRIIVIICCVLPLTQCASIRQHEAQSWKSARSEWNNEGAGKQGVSDAALREGQVGAKAPASSTPVAGAAQAPAPSQAAQEPVPMPAAPGVVRDTNELFYGLISEAMWNELFPNRLGRGTSAGRSDFYSFDAFKAATKHFPRFLTEGDEEIRRRELAAFLAHLAQETGGFRYLEQLTILRSYSVANKEYPPVEGRDYHGRGPIQLSYNYNYGQFSKAYFGDKNVLLKNPELLVTDSVVSFGSAIWFWMTMQPPKPACHDVMVGSWQPVDIDVEAKRYPGFGLTLNIINASQCGKESEHANRRYDIYEKMCKYFDATKGDYCDCEKQLPYGKKLR